MRTVVFEAEVQITEKQAKKLLKNSALVWDVTRPILSIYGKDVKLTRCYVREKKEIKNGY